MYLTIVCDSTLTFIVIGDWGAQIGYNDPQAVKSQIVVRDRMVVIAKDNPLDFILNTGDNFYPSGVESVTDEKWKADWIDVYHQRSLSVDWWNVLGNHDWYGNVTAQVEFSKRNDKWMFPNNYYSVDFPIGDGENATFVFIDTTPFADKVAPVDQQIVWLDKTLKHAQNRIKILVGHHPMYTPGLESIQDLMNEYSISTYFNGHSHKLNYYTCEDTNADFFTSGAGCRVPVTTEDEENEVLALTANCTVQFTKTRAGFMLVELSTTKMTSTFIQANGDILYTRKQKWS